MEMDAEYTSTSPSEDEAMDINDDANKENVGNRLLIPAESDLTSDAGDPSRKRTRPTPRPIVRKKKTAITAHKKKHKTSQPPNLIQHQNIPPLNDVDVQSNLQVQQPDNESTTRAGAPLASLPPYMLCRKINSLNNKLVKAVEKTNAAESKCSNKEMECKTINQELRREKKVGNQLLKEETEKVAAALKEAQSAEKEAQSAKEEAELNVERLLEEMEKLKIECREKIHDERRYCKQAKEDLIVKHAKELRGHELIVAKLKEMHENELERLNNGFAKQLQKQKSLLEKETDRADDVMDKLATVDERHAAILREVRALQRDMLKKSYNENEQLRNDIRDLEEMMEELCDENTAAIKQAKVSDKAAAKANDSAQKQRSKINDILTRLKEVERELADESHRRYEFEIQANESAPTGHEIKRESRVGLRGGSGKWPARLVLLICELLVNGVAPTAIRGTLQSTSDFFRGEEATVLPQESFIRECRTVVQNMNTMLVAYTLANSPAWVQLFTDGTGRRQTSMQNLIIRFKDSNGNVDNVIVSSCIYSEDETSERVSAAVIDMFDELKIQLQAFRDVVIAQCPEFIDLIPTVDGIEFDKFENNSVVMTDTCNGARKTNILIKTEICKQTGKTIHLLLCYNHLRNVWIKNVLKESTAFLREYLLTSLEEIAPVLRVSPCMSGIARAFDREFSLCANYPKGHGQLFQQWMKRNHLGELLLHVERAESGGRQDVVPMASLAIYWNRNYCIEFLDYMLGITRPNKEDSILVQNPYVILSSLEMVAAARMWGIIHIAILMPIRWLSGNIHELDVNNWCYFHLGMVLDRLKEKLDDIVEHPELIHDEEFMMSIIWHWKKDLPSFNKYYKYQFEEKRMDYVVTPEASGTKAVPLYEVRKELFDPDDDDNIACTEFLEEISAIAAETWIAELLNPKKGTYQFMSDSNSAYCYKNVTEELKRAAMGKLAVNDLAESSFAGLTAQLKSFGRADLKSLAAVSDLAFNGFMDRPLTSDEIKNDQRGFFHTWPEELKLALASSAMEIKSATKKSNNIALERLHRAKQQKEEVMRLAGITKATEEYIQCLIYHTMSKSDRCWKTAADVKKGLASIQYVKDQELALKDNIQMRYLGMGFNDCHTTWTKDRKKKSIDTLAKRLIEIIKLTRVRPTPDRLVPKHCGEKRKEMPRMGHITAAVVYIHEKRAERINEFDLSCRRIWKERDTTMVARMQKPGAVSINDAHVGKRIEILSEFGEENDDYDPDAEDIAPKTSMWCQGTIVVVDEENESAWVEWDAIPSVGYPAS